MRISLLLFVLSIFLFSCKHDHDHKHDHGHADHKKEAKEKHGHNHGHKHADANELMNENDFQDLVNRFESPERDAYQKPALVIEKLGDLDGKTIMEIGAGTGYFSFRMVKAGAKKVIAADVDDRFQKYILDKKTKLSISDDQLELRKVPYESPNLADNEVDIALIVNTYHHIEDRSAYFTKVKKGLKPGGKLVVIDFFKKETPMGPPVEMKLSADTVRGELKKAGFTTFEVMEDVLEYQYILVAR